MDSEKTLIDAQSTIEGKLTGKDARVLGRFKGEVELSGLLHVGESGRVEAKVKADAVEIAGQYDGELQARSLVLLEKARVNGTLDAQTIAVREGAQVNGTVNAGGKGKPVVPAVPRPAPTVAPGVVAG